MNLTHCFFNPPSMELNLCFRSESLVFVLISQMVKRYFPILQADFTDTWGKSSYHVTSISKHQNFSISFQYLFLLTFFLVNVLFAVLSYLFYSWLVATVRNRLNKDSC